MVVPYDTPYAPNGHSRAGHHLADVEGMVRVVVASSRDHRRAARRRRRGRRRRVRGCVRHRVDKLRDHTVEFRAIEIGRCEAGTPLVDEDLGERLLRENPARSELAPPGPPWRTATGVRKPTS